MEEVLEAGVCDVVGKPMFLQKWHNTIRLQREKINSIPIWVKLYNVPHALWDEDGMSYVASAIGKPLYMDKATKLRQRISYAKVCVEINTKSSLPNSFEIEMGNGDIFEVEVEYCWLPEICKKCDSFGHKECVAKKKEMWVPVQKNSLNQIEKDSKGHGDVEHMDKVTEDQVHEDQGDEDVGDKNQDNVPIANSMMHEDESSIVEQNIIKSPKANVNQSNKASESGRRNKKSPKRSTCEEENTSNRFSVLLNNPQEPSGAKYSGEEGFERGNTKPPDK